MKHSLILLLFEFCSTVCVLSQVALQEFVIEKDNNPQVFYKSKGCTPDVGVIVFYTTIPNLKFGMPDTPNRLKNISAFDKENNCYVLCVQPTDTKIGGIMQYSLDITGAGYKPMPAFMISGIMPGVAQYFKIKIEEDWKSVVDSLKVEIAKLNGKNNAVAGSGEQKTVVSAKEEIIKSKGENAVATETIEQKSVTPIYSAMSWYSEGSKNYLAGNFLEAIRCYQNAIAINSTMDNAWLGLANAYFHQGNYTEAVECYKKIALNRPSTLIWNCMGISYNNLRDYSNAVQCFENSIKINYNDDVAWYNLGVAHGALNNNIESMECYLKAAQLGNKDAKEFFSKMNTKWY